MEKLLRNRKRIKFKKGVQNLNFKCAKNYLLKCKTNLTKAFKSTKNGKVTKKQEKN